jgi:hypothetical protein
VYRYAFARSGKSHDDMLHAMRHSWDAWEDVALALEMFGDTRAASRMTDKLRGPVRQRVRAALVAGDVVATKRLWAQVWGWDGDQDALATLVPVAMVAAGSVGDPHVQWRALDLLMPALGAMYAVFHDRRTHVTRTKH